MKWCFIGMALLDVVVALHEGIPSDNAFSGLMLGVIILFIVDIIASFTTESMMHKPKWVLAVFIIGIAAIGYLFVNGVIQDFEIVVNALKMVAQYPQTLIGCVVASVIRIAQVKGGYVE